MIDLLDIDTTPTPHLLPAGRGYMVGLQPQCPRTNTNTEREFHRLAISPARFRRVGVKWQGGIAQPWAHCSKSTATLPVANRRGRYIIYG